LPVLFFILSLLGLFISVLMFKKNHYQHSLLAIFIGALLFVLLGHFLLNRLQPARRFPLPMRRFYQHRQIFPSISPRPCSRGNCPLEQF